MNSKIMFFCLVGLVMASIVTACSFDSECGSSAARCINGLCVQATQCRRHLDCFAKVSIPEKIKR